MLDSWRSTFFLARQSWISIEVLKGIYTTYVFKAFVATLGSEKISAKKQKDGVVYKKYSANWILNQVWLNQTVETGESINEENLHHITVLTDRDQILRPQWRCSRTISWIEGWPYFIHQLSGEDLDLFVTGVPMKIQIMFAIIWANSGFP